MHKKVKAKRKRQPRKPKNSTLTILSAVIVTTFLFVVVVGAIGKITDAVEPKEEVLSQKIQAYQESEDEEKSSALYTISLMADSEDDLVHLQKALELSKEADNILYLGDYTSWGDLSSLRKSRLLMDSAGVPYTSIPGDHDLADSVKNGDPSGLSNFGKVFGDMPDPLKLGNFTLVFLNNSANYSTISEKQLNQFRNDLKNADFVFLSQPLYHPTFNRVMGVVDGRDIAEVRAQAEEILSTIRESNVKAVISADQHLFSKHSDPVRSSLEHIVIGALNADRNLQTPRFCILYLMDDGGYEIKEVVL